MSRYKRYSLFSMVRITTNRINNKITVMNILKFNEFDGNPVNEALDKSIKTVMNIFISPGLESDYMKFKLNGDYKSAENLTKKLGKDIENYLKSLTKTALDNFEPFVYDEKASDYPNLRFEYKSVTPFNNYDLKEKAAPFFESIFKANKDKSSKMYLNVISIGENGNKIIKYGQDVFKPSDLKWEDFKGEVK